MLDVDGRRYQLLVKTTRAICFSFFDTCSLVRAVWWDGHDASTNTYVFRPIIYRLLPDVPARMKRSICGGI